MKYIGFDIGGEIVKQDDRYIVKDNNTLKNLIVSSTALHPGKSTSGHRHQGQEEVYLFLSGYGEIELDEEHHLIQAGDIVLIKDGVFHKVRNTGSIDLYFVCIFDGKRNH